MARKPIQKAKSRACLSMNCDSWRWGVGIDGAAEMNGTELKQYILSAFGM